MANTYTYQWQDSADGATGWGDIASATSNTYQVASAESTKYLRCNVTATNAGGHREAVSNVLGPVTSSRISIAPSIAPTIGQLGGR